MEALKETVQTWPSREAGANIPRTKIYDNKFAEQVVMITGAAQGIGKVTAQLFAVQAAHLVLVDVDRELVESLACSLNEAGAKATALTCDISDESSVQSMVDQVVANLGKIDVLVHLAGIYPFIPLVEYPFSTFQKVMNVSMGGCFLLNKAVLPVMQKAGYGRIINTASNTVQWPVARLSAYCAAKAAVIGFTRATAVEAGPGITANVLAPGLIQTERTWSSASPDGASPLFDTVMKRQAVKRHGQPIDIAHTICFIASPEAQFITGQIFDISGGATFF